MIDVIILLESIWDILSISFECNCMLIHTCLVLPEQIFTPNNADSLFISIHCPSFLALSHDIYEYIRSTAMVFDQLLMGLPFHIFASSIQFIASGWLFLSLSISEINVPSFLVFSFWWYYIHSLSVLSYGFAQYFITPWNTELSSANYDVRSASKVCSCLPVIGRFSYQCSLTLRLHTNESWFSWHVLSSSL